MTSPIMAGAEPESIDGGPHGALVLHGFTGNPQSMRGIAHALAAAGFTVEMPLLPGHGTSVEDMIETAWEDWSAAAQLGYFDLDGAVDDIVVVGLSMGGALTCFLAAEHPEIKGIVVINGVVSEPPGIRELVEGMLEAGETVMDAIGSDIADPDEVEMAYPKTPLKPLLSMIREAGALQAKLGDITCPTLIINSANDHVVDPSNSDILAAAVQGPVERMTLERSYHVATLDYDKDDIEKATVEFARRVTES
jgi:carboxylesterase